MMHRAHSLQRWTADGHNSDMAESAPMNRSLTAHPMIWGSDAPYAPGFLGQSGIGLSLPMADDVLDQFADRAYEPAEFAHKHSSFDEGFSFASYPSGVSAWNPPTPELADGSSHYSSSMSMSRSASVRSSYQPGPSSYVPGSSLYSDNDLFVPNKMQLSYMGTAFDTPISPTDDFLTRHSFADMRNMPLSPMDMSRTMSSSSTGSHDLLTGITANEPAAPPLAEYPRRRGPRLSHSGRSSGGGSNAATAGGSPAPQAPPNRKLQIPRALARAASPARGRHHKLLCDKCDRTPMGFRGDHELMRHKRLFHSKSALKWVCADLRAEGGVAGADDWMAPKLGLDQCPNCRNGKQYGQYYNAAAHLRRFHFHPKPRGRPKGDDMRRRRAGSAGGDHPSIATLKRYWLRAVNVRNAEGAVDDGAEAAEAERDQRLRDDDDAPAQARGDRRHRRRSSSATDDDGDDGEGDDVVAEDAGLLSADNLAQALRQAARRGDLAEDDIYRYRDIWRRFSDLAGEMAPEPVAPRSRPS